MAAKHSQKKVARSRRRVARPKRPYRARASNVAEKSPFDRILQIAAKSEVANFHWNGRGVAPLAYIKGMALCFGRAYCKLKNGNPPAVDMAKADAGDFDHDALAHYRQQFAAAGMDNGQGGADTLRHLFVLLMGLGMRESSGKFCEGLYEPDGNTTAETAEAGLFQTSYNARVASKLLPDLFQHYLAHPDGFLEVFSEGVKCRPDDAVNYGSGPGKQFQSLSKSCPAFAAEFAAVAMRHSRNHWSPLRKGNRDAEIPTAADKMFKAVQKEIEASGLCAALLGPAAAPSWFGTEVTIAKKKSLAAAPAPSTSKLVVTADGLNLRDAPSLQSKVITSLSKGAVVDWLNSSGDDYWRKVKSGSDTGWASHKYLIPQLQNPPASGGGTRPWLPIAYGEVGVKEVAASGANPRIVEYLHSTNLGAPFNNSDETAWCSSFVNWCVEHAGAAGTDSASALSWAHWGTETNHPVPGDIVIFDHGGGYGHVGFFTAISGASVLVLGGNQHNEVCTTAYLKGTVYRYRQPA